MCHRVDEGKMQIKSEFEHHLLNEWDIHNVKMYLLNHLCDPIQQLRNLFNGSVELPEPAIPDL